jgi:hypothetical protein
MEKESAKNGKESMIMMSTMIWVTPTQKLPWLVQFLEETAPCLILEEAEQAEKQLKKVKTYVLTFSG